MKRRSVAEAKAHLSSLLKAVEAGDEVEITRRGVPVARLCPAEPRPNTSFDLGAFLAETTAQPMHQGPDTAAFCRDLREENRH
ncbi:MAG: type II toxin-antitoxin system prevent-host-death family antitoxin [Cyanobacteria bacterium K_Offshore_0m_m2_072]|nr:type II toxin-antitoxin system prevent-host-death family antitoxin [Cyanobacteria bacterium K_Offshore_0m_m2_072]